MAQKDKGTLRPASGCFRRKRTKYPSRIKWRRCQILTLTNDPRVQFDLPLQTLHVFLKDTVIQVITTNFHRKILSDSLIVFNVSSQM